MKNVFLILSLQFFLGLSQALPADLTNLHIRRREPNVDLNEANLAKRIEEWAKSSVGFISRSRAAAGFKCADQVSQILWHANAGVRPTFGVEILVEDLMRRGWSHSRTPKGGCLIYSFIDMPPERSHVGIVVSGNNKLREQVLSVLKDYNIEGQETLNEFLEIQKQLPFVNDNDSRRLIAKLEFLSKQKSGRPKHRLTLQEQRRQQLLQQQLAGQILARFQHDGRESFTIVHNQIAALREGPFDMEDLNWMLKARFLCPKN